jgi:CheY-like chemotaxis protein
MPRIHAAEPQSVPVLLVTCAVMPETAGLKTRSLSAAFAAGCDAFDAKPIQFERLLATLRRLGQAAGDGGGRS